MRNVGELRRFSSHLDSLAARVVIEPQKDRHHPTLRDSLYGCLTRIASVWGGAVDALSTPIPLPVPFVIGQLTFGGGHTPCPKAAAIARVG